MAAPGRPPGPPLTVVSADSHVGPLPHQLRRYCPSALLDAFDAEVERNSHRAAISRAKISLAEVGLSRRLGEAAEARDPFRNRRSDGHHDSAARLADMDRDGVAASIIFHGSQNGHVIPFVEFTASFYGKVPAPARQALEIEGRRIYNRWLADFCSGAPDRHIGLCQVPAWDPFFAERAERGITLSTHISGAEQIDPGYRGPGVWGIRAVEGPILGGEGSCFAGPGELRLRPPASFPSSTRESPTSTWSGSGAPGRLPPWSRTCGTGSARTGCSPSTTCASSQQSRRRCRCGGARCRCRFRFTPATWTRSSAGSAWRFEKRLVAGDGPGRRRPRPGHCGAADPSRHERRAGRRLPAADRGPRRRGAGPTLGAGALRVGRRAGRGRRPGPSSGRGRPLLGVPVLAKDNIDVAGMATTAGSLAALQGWNLGVDSEAVRRLRRAGTVILGKTNMTEWANFMASGVPARYSAAGGQVRNPYDTGRSPGGSSSGSAVAVAAGLCPLAVGTETMGSILSPADACPVVGVRPTPGTAGRRGVVPVASSYDTVEPLAGAEGPGQPIAASS